MEIDLRGLTFEEAQPLVDKYLDDVSVAGFNNVTLIHGKGTGDIVHVPREVQVDRVMARDELSREAAHQRLDAQLDPAKKVAEAHWVIDNSKSLADTAKQVDTLVEQLQRRAQAI